MRKLLIAALLPALFLAGCAKESAEHGEDLQKRPDFHAESSVPKSEGENVDNEQVSKPSRKDTKNKDVQTTKTPAKRDKKPVTKKAPEEMTPAERKAYPKKIELDKKKLLKRKNEDREKLIARLREEKKQLVEAEAKKAQEMRESAKKGIAGPMGLSIGQVEKILKNNGIKVGQILGNKKSRIGTIQIENGIVFLAPRVNFTARLKEEPNNKHIQACNVEALLGSVKPITAKKIERTLARACPQK